ncbi:hypothetical protein EJB05_46718, partial [Eragrostis curvula]
MQLCYEPDVVAYTILLRLYGRVGIFGKIKLAEDTFLEMLEAGCEPDAVACGTLLCAYARWGRHKDMMLFYSAVRRRDIVPPISVFNYMISSLQKQKLHAKVIHVWKQMREANVAPNQFTYTVVVSSYAKQGLLEEAMDVFGEMRRRRFVPEETTYSLLISLSSKHGKGEQALRLFEEMRGHGIDTFEEIEKAGLLSDEQTYVAMAQVHMNARDYDRALEVLQSMRMRNVKPSNFSYGALLRCYVAKEDIVSAEDTFRVLSTCGLPDVFCCNDLLRLYLRLRHLEKARALILKMREENFQLDEDLCMTVMEFYCKSSMVDDAEKLFKEIQRNGKTMKIATTISLIEMYARNRISMFLKEESLPRALDSTDSSAANIVLKSLLDMPEGLSNACQLISKLAREGDTDHAKFLYEQLTALGTKPDDSALATLIVQYGQNQQLEQAQELFQSASASSLVGSHVYNAMVDSLCKCGKTDEAYNLFMEMADQGNNRDAVTVSILVSHLTKHVCCTHSHKMVVFLPGKFQEAENIVHGCFRDKVQLDTVVYNTFIKLMLESGKLHSAVSIYERMISSGISPSMQTFNIMISVYGKGGKLDKAIQTFAAAQELGLPIDEKSYTNMLSLYGKAGRHRKASLLFDR